MFTFARPPPTFYPSRRKAGKTVTVRHNIIIVQEKSDGIWLNIAPLVSALQCRVRKTFEEIKSDNVLTNRSVVWRDEDTDDSQVSIIILFLFVFIYFHHIFAYQQIFMRSIYDTRSYIIMYRLIYYYWLNVIPFFEKWEYHAILIVYMWPLFYFFILRLSYTYLYHVCWLICLSNINF